MQTASRNEKEPITNLSHLAKFYFYLPLRLWLLFFLPILINNAANLLRAGRRPL